MVLLRFKRFLSSMQKIVFFILTAILILGIILCIYTPNYTAFNWSRYAPQIAIGYWVLGMILFFFRQYRLQFIAFACCALLCLHLQNVLNNTLTAPQLSREEPIIKIAQFNLSASKGHSDSTIHYILKTEADIISLQEVTPEWQKRISDSFKLNYPYSCSVLGADINNSILIFSKYAFSHCDTVYCNRVPILLAHFSNNYIGKFTLIGNYMAPPLFQTAYKQLLTQLDTLQSITARIKTPVISFGDYNIHPSSYEIRKFRENSNLVDSRRGFRLDRNDGYISLFDVPTDYIFHSPHFNCIEFKTINGPKYEHLGIIGVYQFNTDSIKSPLKKFINGKQESKSRK